MNEILEEIETNLKRALELGARHTWTSERKHKGRDAKREEAQCWQRVWELLGTGREAMKTNYGSSEEERRLKSIKKDDKVPNVGDTVRLNDYGLRQIFGHTHGLSFMKQKEMRITEVDSVSMTYPEPTFTVEVDDPEISAYMIDHHCFDIVRRA